MATGIISNCENGVDLVVEWKIENFFNLPETDGTLYWRPDFSFGGERWRLGISPNGSSVIDSFGHVGLVLSRRPSDRSIKQSFSLSLKTAEGEKYNEQHFSKDFDNDNYYHIFNRLIPRSELSNRRSNLAPEGTLTVICTMKSSALAGSAISIYNSACIEICTSDTDSAEGFSDSDFGKCCHCKENFATGSLSSHLRKCMQRPIKCPDCLEVIVLQKWLDKHECQQERPKEEEVPTAEVNKSDVAGSSKPEASGSSQAATTTTKELVLKWIKENCKEASKGKKRKMEKENVLKWIEENFNETSEGKKRKKKNVSFRNQPEDYGFVTDINHLLKENRGLDVTFELETLSGKTKLFAHQLILAVMSSYFADEFYDKGRNKGHQVIVLKGINPKAFEQMIRYCYDEKPTFKTTEESCVLFKIASEFKMISLQNLCCSFFRHTKINPGNVFSILEISEEMEDKSLKDKCRKILQDRTREVMASYELRDVTPAMVHILLDLPSLSLDSEYELIKWIFDWAKVKSEDKDSSCRSTRDYLEKLLRNMNFFALTVEEFAILSRENPKVFNSDERASISLNIACPGSWEMPVQDLKLRVYTGSIE